MSSRIRIPPLNFLSSKKGEALTISEIFPCFIVLRD